MSPQAPIVVLSVDSILIRRHISSHTKEALSKARSSIDTRVRESEEAKSCQAFRKSLVRS
jgi:hypothetical protein